MGKGIEWVTKHYHIGENSHVIHSVKNVSRAE